MKFLLTKMNLFTLSVCFITSIFSTSVLAQMSQEGLDRWLLNASKSKDTESIRATVEAGADVHVTDENGCTPLMYMIASSSCRTDDDVLHSADTKAFTTRAVDILVSAGALEQISANHLSGFLLRLEMGSINRKEYFREQVRIAINGMPHEQLNKLLLGMTSLPTESHDDIWSITVMISAGADVNVRDDDENICTPLMNAIGAFPCGDLGRYHYSVVDTLFQSGVDLNSIRSDQKDAFLMRASEFGAIEHVTFALNAGADVDGGLFYKASFKPPLFRASANCHVDIVRMLIIAGASIHYMKDIEGKEWTALDIARENCSEHFGTIRVLQDAGGITSRPIRPVVP